MVPELTDSPLSSVAKVAPPSAEVHSWIGSLSRVEGAPKTSARIA
jgi:hypothetical protein